MFIPKYETKPEGCFTFGEKVCATANACLDNEAIKSFWRGFCRQGGELEITPCDELCFTVGSAQKPSLDGGQYAVNIEKTGVCIVGDSEKSLIKGFMTLLDLIEAKELTDEKSVFEIGCGCFREKLPFEYMMVHFCIFPETELWELERFIRVSAALKYSHIVLEFWGMLRYDCLKELGWSFAFEKEQIKPLIRMANDLGLEVIPMFNHWGHASASRAMNGKHVVLDQNPRLQPLFSKDGWTWAIAKPEVQKLLSSVRRELIELCGEGRFFHLGCDEAYNFEITCENYTVLTDYLNGIADELALSGRRPLVWGDMLIAKHEGFNTNNRYIVSCRDVETEQKILSALSRRIIIADWQYSASEAPVETALIFKNAGFDTLLCPWDSVYSRDSIAPCVNTVVQHSLFGVMQTTWNTLSIGMRDVSKAAFAAWCSSPGEELPSLTYFSVKSAETVRCAYPVNGDYEKAGWAKHQVADILR